MMFSRNYAYLYGAGGGGSLLLYCCTTTEVDFSKEGRITAANLRVEQRTEGKVKLAEKCSQRRKCAR